jgi:hypothetical protein
MNGPSMNDRDGRPDIVSAVQHVTSLAERLPAGELERHVAVSAQELARACSDQEGVFAAVDRLVEGIRQLQLARSQGARRQEQHGAAAVERLLEAFQEELLPELRRAGLI